VDRPGILRGQTERDNFGDATFGGAILDRLVHHAHRITLTGGSLRRLPTTDASATQDH